MTPHSRLLSPKLTSAAAGGGVGAHRRKQPRRLGDCHRRGGVIRSPTHRCPLVVQGSTAPAACSGGLEPVLANELTTAPPRQEASAQALAQLRRWTTSAVRSDRLRTAPSRECNSATDRQDASVDRRKGGARAWPRSPNRGARTAGIVPTRKPCVHVDRLRESRADAASLGAAYESVSARPDRHSRSRCNGQQYQRAVGETKAWAATSTRARRFRASRATRR